jgi:hypothetical protein
MLLLLLFSHKHFLSPSCLQVLYPVHPWRQTALSHCPQKEEEWGGRFSQREGNDEGEVSCARKEGEHQESVVGNRGAQRWAVHVEESEERDQHALSL